MPPDLPKEGTILAFDLDPDPDLDNLRVPRSIPELSSPSSEPHTT
jgi:hypothetical protein